MKTEKTIRVGYSLPGPGVPSSAPTYDYSRLLDRRVTLYGVGENQTFDRNLPRTATILRQIALDDWGPDWLVLGLEKPFDYEGTSVRVCLIRGRWQGCPIGSEFCPAFVLIDRRDLLDAKDRWTSADFTHATWGEVEVDA